MRNFSILISFINKIIHSKYGLILIILTTFMILGLFIADDYGLSWDEYKDLNYGQAALKAYKGFDDFQWLGKDRKYYGPFYWMSVNLVSTLADSIGIKVFYIDVWKYCHFFVFQISLFSFFLLCSRFLKKIPAFITVLLFATQPLLFGHAFINPKDIPFMSFFMTSIVVGLLAVDIFQKGASVSEISLLLTKQTMRDAWKSRLKAWQKSSIINRTILIILITLFVSLSIEFLGLNVLFLPWMKKILLQAYNGTAAKPIMWLFNLIAQDAYKTPAEMYLDKIAKIYSWGRFLILFLLLMAGVIIWRMIFRKGGQKISVNRWLRGHYAILLAGILLGLTTSIRVAAPFAGILVSIYFLVKSRHRAIMPLMLYWIVAALIMYATWPYLWDAPVDRFLESVKVSSSFISHQTLFSGTILQSTNLPWYYALFLMIIQFTEPLLILALIGIVTSIIGFYKSRIDRLDFIILILWAGIPTILITVFRIPVYDNFRQLFFTIPPLIVFSGIGVSMIIEQTKPWILKSIVILLVLVPGLIGIVKLHPYEYIFYNSLVGGVNHAYGNYELDYWCTSFRETINYVNRIAPPNSALYIEGPVAAAMPFAREDLKINDPNLHREDLDYAIACRYSIWREDYYPDFKTIYEVRRGQGILSVLKSR
jgi:hypothetical protein